MKKNIGQKLAGEALDKVWRDVYNQEKDLEKKKVLKRNAYGYRDIAYLKLRLFNLHNDKITRFVGCRMNQKKPVSSYYMLTIPAKHK